MFILYTYIMDKKQLIITILTKLKPYRNLAEGLLALVESQYIDDKTIDWLIHIFASSIKEIKNTGDKEKLEKGLALVKKLKKQEDTEQLQDEESVDNLLDTI